MSDDSEQSITDKTSPSLSHTRIKFLIGFAAIAGSVASAILISPAFGIGVLLGGVMALINFYWLGHSLGLILGEASKGAEPRMLVVRYLARYSAIAAALVIVFATKLLPIESVLLGIAAIAPAILIEAFIQIFSSFFKKEGR